MSNDREDESTEYSVLDTLIVRVKGGDNDAVESLLELAYNRLHNIARRIVGFKRGTPSKGATSLVNEGFLRLFERDQFKNVRDTHHFYCLYAKLMQHILIEHERRNQTQKRGGDANRVDLDILLSHIASQENSVSDLAEAITELEKRDPRAAETIRLKFFAFMTVDSICETTKVSRSTVESDLRIAKAFIRSFLND